MKKNLELINTWSADEAIFAEQIEARVCKADFRVCAIEYTDKLRLNSTMFPFDRR